MDGHGWAILAGVSLAGVDDYLRAPADERPDLVEAINCLGNAIDSPLGKIILLIAMVLFVWRAEQRIKAKGEQRAKKDELERQNIAAQVEAAISKEVNRLAPLLDHINKAQKVYQLRDLVRALHEQNERVQSRQVRNDTYADFFTREVGSINSVYQQLLEIRGQESTKSTVLPASSEEDRAKVDMIEELNSKPAGVAEAFRDYWARAAYLQSELLSELNAAERAEREIAKEAIRNITK